MKNLILSSVFGFLLCGSAAAINFAPDTNSTGFSESVTISTTPALFVSSATQVDQREVTFINTTAVVAYINFSLPTSSTTAAANGIPVYQNTATFNGAVRLLLSGAAKIYMTLAASSGTSSLRDIQLGVKP